MEKKIFQMLANLDVSEKVEKRDNLSYLSWAWAWRHFKEACPDATYKVIINEQTGLPYFESSAGAMVRTEVTACGETHMMWLPVMDSRNKAMKSHPYDIQTRSGVVTIKAYDMFDINKAIMRCLAKNIAMFGLGLYIYAGEDLPEQSIIQSEEEVQTLINKVNECTSIEEVNTIWLSKEAQKYCNVEKFRAAVVSKNNQLNSAV